MAKVITAAVASTNYKIGDLMLALDSKEQIHCHSVTFRAVAGNANPILIGGPDMTDTNYGLSLSATDAPVTLNSGSGINHISLNDLYIRGITTANLKLSVLNLTL